MTVVVLVVLAGLALAAVAGLLLYLLLRSGSAEFVEVDTVDYDDVELEALRDAVARQSDRGRCYR